MTREPIYYWTTRALLAFVVAGAFYAAIVLALTPSSPPVNHPDPTSGHSSLPFTNTLQIVSPVPVQDPYNLYQGLLQVAGSDN